MANTITVTPIVDGAKNLTVLVNIDGDASGEETGTILIDRSAYAPTGTKMVLNRVEGHLTGFSATLLWDGTADLPICQLPDGEKFCYDFTAEGGISSNKAGAGATGDLLITTSDLGNENGTFTLHLAKYG